MHGQSAADRVMPAFTNTARSVRSAMFIGLQLNKIRGAPLGAQRAAENIADSDEYIAPTHTGIDHFDRVLTYAGAQTGDQRDGGGDCSIDYTQSTDDA